ncbi:peptidase dimerization domain-containing protein [Ktedonobacter sp. SOSP1-52]|uniref:peptidase dimerization domain-containing protein n=1 Tax=Ktedonobacter sp. SOSP1-52 TaxID=2778366 RepID=UPI001915DBEC|nr:peptidase dimerization domain-containing protein [Ktedonobacter sp. SOSP1-52]
MIDTTFYAQLQAFERMHPFIPTEIVGEALSSRPEGWLDQLQGRLGQLGFTQPPLTTSTTSHPPIGKIPILFYSERCTHPHSTLLLYNSYSLSGNQPWHSLPIFAYLQALEAVKHILGDLPLSIKWLIHFQQDTETDLLPAFLRANQSRLQANACLWDDTIGTYEAGLNATSAPLLLLGSKGRLGVSLYTTSPQAASHSMHGGIAPGAAWRLLWALQSIKDEHEQIHLKGFYDAIELPTEELLQATAELLDRSELLRQRWGLPALALDLEGLQLHYTQLLVPTCSLTMLTGLPFSANASDNGEHVVTHAQANLDFHLVAGQVPERVYTQLRHHLDERAFHDVQTRWRYGYPPTPAQTPDVPFVQLARASSELAYGQRPALLPTTASSQPLALLAAQHSLPFVITALAGEAETSAFTRQTALLLASFAQRKSGER